MKCIKKKNKTKQKKTQFEFGFELLHLGWLVGGEFEMSVRFHVGGKVVDTVDLLKKRHWSWRLDVWPFAVLYAAWIVTVLPSLDFVDAAIVLGGLAVLHILVFLFTGWSVDFRCFVQYSKC
ncbi:unnamed protein product [Camellia sinensis]